MSPLDDNSMYLQLAQQAAQRGNNSPAPSSGMPMPSSPALPPQVIQAFVQGLPQIIPNITPPQAEAVVKLLMQALQAAERAENEPQGAMA